jgi:hypothetical protein
MGVEEQKRNPLTIEELKKKYPNLHVNWRRAELPDGYIDWVYEIPEAEDMFLTEDGAAFERKDLRFVDYDIVNITPRESYMILDCFQFVLNKMDKENIDYLFCNYSKEEIAKLGQRFGNLNLKNQW